MLQGIENIVFDLGGVMIDLDRARCVEEFHKIGFTEIDDLIDSYHPKGFLGRLERGDVTNDDFYDYVRRSAGRDIADDEIRRAFTSFLAGIPRYKLQMVRTQRERGFRTYALSNINDVVFPFVRDVLFTQEGLQLDDYFEKAYLSYEMHELKPSPEIYRKMIEKSGMRPEATLILIKPFITNPPSPLNKCRITAVHDSFRKGLCTMTRCFMTTDCSIPDLCIAAARIGIT